MAASRDKLWADLEATIDLIVQQSGWEIDPKEIKRVKTVARNLVPSRLQPRQAVILGIALYTEVGNMIALKEDGEKLVSVLADQIITQVREDRDEQLNADLILQLVRDKVFEALEIPNGEGGPIGNDGLYLEPHRLFSLN